MISLANFRYLKTMNFHMVNQNSIEGLERYFSFLAYLAEREGYFEHVLK